MVPLVAKLKVQSVKNPNNEYWLYCLGVVHEHTDAYKKAIECYTSCYEKEAYDVISYRISQCYSNMGDFTSALKHIDNAIALDSTDYDYVMEKANLLYESGNAKDAIMELGKYISHQPDYFGEYYRRGWFKDNSEDTDGAIEDYTMAIVLQPDYAYAYLGRGDMYALKGNKKSSEADYKKVVELDTIPNNSSCAQYAYWCLGQKEKNY